MENMFEKNVFHAAGSTTIPLQKNVYFVSRAKKKKNEKVKKESNKKQQHERRG